MKIEVLYTPDCLHYVTALQLVHDALAETGIEAQVELVRVETEDDARRLRFIGSPTVRVDDVDVEPYVTFAAGDFGRRCRMYVEDEQALGWPGQRMLRDTIEVGHLAEMGMLATCC
ncbi:MAG: hypothetical protein HZB20_05550 [Chloroflexi bacterium]|nr:hypothetical protein [Chloroflexota bacterium]